MQWRDYCSFLVNNYSTCAKIIAEAVWLQQSHLPSAKLHSFWQSIEKKNRSRFWGLKQCIIVHFYLFIYSFILKVYLLFAWTFFIKIHWTSELYTSCFTHITRSCASCKWHYTYCKFCPSRSPVIKHSCPWSFYRNKPAMGPSLA